MSFTSTSSCINNLNLSSDKNMNINQGNVSLNSIDLSKTLTVTALDDYSFESKQFNIYLIDKLPFISLTTTPNLTKSILDDGTNSSRTISFQFDCVTTSLAYYTVDFGDGNLKRNVLLSHPTYVTHVYSTIGYYLINIFVFNVAESRNLTFTVFFFINFSF